MTYKEACAAKSETAKYRNLTTQYCQGNGIDIGSGGDPVVPWAIQIELSEADYANYNNHNLPRGPVQYRASGALFDLPFKDETLDFVYSSHVLEDYARGDWRRLLPEWARVLKKGGYLIILVPEVDRWTFALQHLGQPPNCSHHSPEPRLLEVSVYVLEMKDRHGFDFECRERLTNQFANDYSILFVGKKL